jgi:hypothetical protein
MLNEDTKKPSYRAAGDSKLESVQFEDGGLTLVVPGLLQDKLTFVSSTTVLETKYTGISIPARLCQFPSPGNSVEQRGQRSSEAIIRDMQ